MAVIGVGTLAPRRGEGRTSKHRTLQCHACPAQATVSFKHPGEIAGKVREERGWEIADGTISCPTHARERVMPRHGQGRVARGGGETRMART